MLWVARAGRAHLPGAPPVQRLPRAGWLHREHRPRCGERVWRAGPHGIGPRAMLIKSHESATGACKYLVSGQVTQLGVRRVVGDATAGPACHPALFPHPHFPPLRAYTSTHLVPLSPVHICLLLLP